MKSEAGIMFVPRLTSFAICLAIAMWSPVTILTFMPIFWAVFIVWRVFAGRVVNCKKPNKLPVALFVSLNYSYCSMTLACESVYNFVNSIFDFYLVGNKDKTT